MPKSTIEMNFHVSPKTCSHSESILLDKTDGTYRCPRCAQVFAPERSRQDLICRMLLLLVVILFQSVFAVRYMGRGTDSRLWTVMLDETFAPASSGHPALR